MKTTQTTQTQAATTRLDRRVSSRILARFRRHLPEVLIHRGLVEARELAADTGWAVLVFPLLAEEIVTRLASVAGAATETLAVAA